MNRRRQHRHRIALPALAMTLLAACGDDVSKELDASEPDAQVDDAGVEIQDAESKDALGADVPLDAGEDPLADAGASDDAGVNVDAGEPADPLLLLPYAGAHVNAVRLDDQHIVIAYSDNPDRNAPQDMLTFRVLERTGDNFMLGDPVTIPIPLIEPFKDEGVLMMGALGPDYFVMVTEAPDWSDTLHFFARSGSNVTHLGSDPLGQTEAVGGHPVDDQRYLLRFRPNTSVDRVRYELLVRTGTTTSRETVLLRPEPTEFPGLSPEEPQTWSPLARLSSNTFREVRGGYVYAPGYLSSWVLTVNADNTLTASDLRVHTNSSTLTMAPFVAADGVGSIVTVYESFGGNRHYGHFTPAGDYVHGAELPVLGDSINSPQGSDSTDGYINGRFFIRTRAGDVYRFDTVDAAPTIEASGLSWMSCFRAPSVLKSGNYAVLLVCGSTQLRVEALPL